jgi:hypothetical protein
MTTQVLTSNSMLLSPVETAQDKRDNNSCSLLASNPQTAPSHSAPVAQAPKLPYQANHQVELLHLQAETEALLQQLKILKQQRSAIELPETEDVELPVLVSR